MNSTRYSEILDLVQSGIPVRRACKSQSERVKFYEEKRRRAKRYAEPVLPKSTKIEIKEDVSENIDVEDTRVVKKEIKKSMILGIINNAKTDSKWANLAFKVLEVIDPDYQKKENGGINENEITKLWENWAGDRNANSDQAEEENNRKQA